MKTNTLRLLFFALLCLLLCNVSAQSPMATGDSVALRKELSFKIVFGVYHDDTYLHKFDAQEREWVLKDGVLMYRIDAHDQRYADTLRLSCAELKTIMNFVEEKKLVTSVNKELSKNYADKMGYSESVTASIQYQGQNAELKITGNSYGSLDDDPQVKLFKELESILYEMAGTMRK